MSQIKDQEHIKWLDTHCYGCGRHNEHIAEFGRTPDCEHCKYNPNTEGYISTLEAEAYRTPDLIGSTEQPLTK